MEYLKSAAYVVFIFIIIIVLIYNLFVMKDIERTKEQFGIILPKIFKELLILNIFFISFVIIFIIFISIIK